MLSVFGKWFCIAFIVFIHPFFVSMTDVSYNNKDKELEISVRIFTDDFENTLRKLHNTKIDILHPANQQQMNSFVNGYIQKHLQMQVNGAPVQMAFLGYEQQGESIWAYLEVKNISAVAKLNITNSLLHDFSNSQVNMLHIKVNDTEKSTKLDYPETTAAFIF